MWELCLCTPIDEDDGTAFVLSDKILDWQGYNLNYVYNEDGYKDYSCSWGTSTLREWLNSDILNYADVYRIAQVTQYAVNNGAYEYNRAFTEFNNGERVKSLTEDGSCFWYLRGTIRKDKNVNKKQYMGQRRLRFFFN